MHITICMKMRITPYYGPNSSNEYPLKGNTSLTSLSDGKYEILMRVVTEKGRGEVVTNFS